MEYRLIIMDDHCIDQGYSTDYIQGMSLCTWALTKMTVQLSITYCSIEFCVSDIMCVHHQYFHRNIADQ